MIKGWGDLIENLTVRRPGSDELEWRTKSNELAALPQGLVIRHIPNTPRAHAWGEGEYKWEYATTIQSEVGQVTIEEFGCFRWTGSGWCIIATEDTPFTSADFSSWYECNNAILMPGVTYTDQNNWTTSDRLSGGLYRWYYIGTDSRGRRVKGEATVELLAQLGAPAVSR